MNGQGRAFYAITFLCSILLWDVHGDEVTGPSPPLPMAAGKEITANLVNVIFWFDRLTTDPPRATTVNYLARVSDPSSPFYPSYLEYKQGTIDRHELEDRLPHVAMLGDSLSQ